MRTKSTAGKPCAVPRMSMGDANGQLVVQWLDPVGPLGAGSSGRLPDLDGSTACVDGRLRDSQGRLQYLMPPADPQLSIADQTLRTASLVRLVTMEVERVAGDGADEGVRHYMDVESEQMCQAWAKEANDGEQAAATGTGAYGVSGAPARATKRPRDLPKQQPTARKRKERAADREVQADVDAVQRAAVEAVQTRRRARQADVRAALGRAQPEAEAARLREELQLLAEQEECGAEPALPEPAPAKRARRR